MRRDALEVKSLAARLIALSPSALAGLPLDEPVRTAIAEARRIRSNVARKRQLQFVAKLLRREDPEPIADALAALDDGARQLSARQHRCEAWRDRLLESGDQALVNLVITSYSIHYTKLYEEHRRQLMRSFERALERDHVKAAVTEISALGLVEMTRKRTTESLERRLCTPCPMCDGRGQVKSTETVCRNNFV